MLPKLAADLGFARLSLALDLNDWGQDSWRERNDPVDIHEAFGIDRALDLQETGKKHGVEVTFWFVDEKYQTNDVQKLCPWPFERAYISSDMRVVPCCNVANPDIFELGDARELTATWNNEKMIQFRRDHLEGRIPDICKTCYAEPVSD
jgi:pyrroloquinoline quinone biosynthesis protein E